MWDRSTGGRRRPPVYAFAVGVWTAGALSGTAAQAAGVGAVPAGRVELVIPVADSPAGDAGGAPVTDPPATADARVDTSAAPPPAAIPFPSAIQLFAPGAALAAYAVHRIRRHRRWGVKR
ncbi:MAG TPA: hypothetical protein VF796_12840 [Humisphaera sp.]